MKFASLPSEFDKMWHAFLSFWSFDRVSLLVSVFALAVSAWVGLISRKNVRVTERTAEAANEQAEAASSQATAAWNQSVLAANTAEVGALEAARTRIDQNAPSAVVAITYIHESPLLAEACFQLPFPHPEPDPSEKLKLTYKDHWHYDVYILLRGIIYNDGDRVVRASPGGAAFYRGLHPLTNAEVPMPQCAVRGTYLLYPGQTALFQILARMQVIDWLKLEEEESDRIRYPCSSFHLRPGSADEPNVVIKVNTEAHPVKRQRDGNGDWIILEPWCYVDVTTEIERIYPTSFDRLHAELKNDDEELHRLMVRDEFIKSLDNKRK